MLEALLVDIGLHGQIFGRKTYYIKLIHVDVLMIVQDQFIVPTLMNNTLIQFRDNNLVMLTFPLTSCLLLQFSCVEMLIVRDRAAPMRLNILTNF